jgi:hypothetical protein
LAGATRSQSVPHDGLTLMKIEISAKAQGLKWMRRLVCVAKPV